MKFNKLFSILALSLVTLTMSAAITSKATIKVSSAYDASDYLYLKVDPAETELVDDILNTVSAASVNFYAVIGSNNYSSVKQASLDNLKLVFKANSLETSYDVTFSDVLGEITLANADTSFVIDATKTYTIKCAKSATVEFTVNPQIAYKRTVTANQAGTICYPKAITSVTGGTLYSLTYATETAVYGEAVTTYPTTAGQPYVFIADATATELVMPYTGEDATAPVAVQGLVGTFADTTTPAGAYGIMGSKVVEIAAGNALLANRAYINMEDLTGTGAPRRGRAIFNVANQATGVELIEAAPAMNGKVMMNGKLVIIRDGKMFNAQGAAL